ncbi:Peptidoglycan O-acetyltransferase, partial [termite gut metagenome]
TTNWSTFNIIMPLGISFFTFKLISYVIEVHRQHIEPTTDVVTFATYVAFFPTIMSGPIDRPNSFIPQLQSKRIFNYDLAVDGCRQILWGMFKKMVVADNCATAVNKIWTEYQGESGGQLLLVAVLFAFQLYADFSGYSDMAIGVGKLLGFKITKNFNYPFFKTNIAEFWRGWHISLTSWLTDYVFMPLNIKFRSIGKWGTIVAIIITFVLVGLWHGANWTFAVFGLYHGLLY